MSDAQFLRHGKVPMALARHDAEKRFHDRCFIENLWHHLLTVTAYEGTVAIFCSLF